MRRTNTNLLSVCISFVLAVLKEKKKREDRFSTLRINKKERGINREGLGQEKKRKKTDMVINLGVNKSWVKIRV